MFNDLIYRQFFDPSSSTYTHLLADPESRQAVLIDTVFEQHFRDLAFLEELGLRPGAARRRLGRQGTVILRQAEFPRIANVHGGMALWRQLGLPIVQV